VYKEVVQERCYRRQDRDEEPSNAWQVTNPRNQLRNGMAITELDPKSNGVARYATRIMGYQLTYFTPALLNHALQNTEIDLHAARQANVLAGIDILCRTIGHGCLPAPLGEVF
jgi:hypothetical protein